MFRNLVYESATKSLHVRTCVERSSSRQGSGPCMERPAQLGELAIPPGKQEARLSICGIVMIDEGGELYDLLAQQRGLGSLRPLACSEVLLVVTTPPALAFAKGLEDVRVIAVEGVTRHASEAAERCDGWLHCALTVTGLLGECSQSFCEAFCCVASLWVDRLF